MEQNGHNIMKKCWYYVVKRRRKREFSRGLQKSYRPLGPALLPLVDFCRTLLYLTRAGHEVQYPVLHSYRYPPPFPEPSRIAELFSVRSARVLSSRIPCHLEYWVLCDMFGKKWWIGWCSGKIDERLLSKEKKQKTKKRGIEEQNKKKTRRFT